MLPLFITKRLAKINYDRRRTAICLGDNGMSFSSADFKFGDDAGLFFVKSLGFQEYISIDYNGNATLNLDLGVPIPQNLIGTADVVYDGGVIEHIPNVWQAFQNGISMVKLGGYYVANSPMNQFENCYWNINPEFYSLQLVAAGFEIVECVVAYNTNIFERMGFLLQRILPAKSIASVQKGVSQKTGLIAYLFCSNRPLILNPKGKAWNILRTIFVPESTSVLVIARKVSEVSNPKPVDQECYRRAV